MKTIFRAVFYLRSNYVNKEGKTPVMLRIYLNNERLSIGSTGIAVQQSQWDSEKERLKGRTTEALSTNLELDNIQSGLQTIFKKLEMTRCYFFGTYQVGVSRQERRGRNDDDTLR